MRPDPKGQANKEFRGYAPPENFECVGCQRCEFRHFFGGGGGGRQSVTENELFMITKLDVASRTVLSFKY